MRAFSSSLRTRSRLSLFQTCQLRGQSVNRCAMFWLELRKPLFGQNHETTAAHGKT